MNCIRNIAGMNTIELEVVARENNQAALRHRKKSSNRRWSKKKNKNIKQSNDLIVFFIAMNNCSWWWTACTLHITKIKQAMTRRVREKERERAQESAQEREKSKKRYASVHNAKVLSITHCSVYAIHKKTILIRLSRFVLLSIYRVILNLGTLRCYPR